MRPTTLLGAFLILSLSSCKRNDEKVEVTTISANKAGVPPAKPADEELEKAAPAKETEAPKEESPVPAIPEGRSKPPTAAEWSQAEAINTQEWNSQAKNCEMKIVREWLKVYCHGDITEFSDLSGFGEQYKDYFVAVRKGRSADFVVRLRKGQTLELKVHRNDARDAVLYVTWPHSEPKPVHVALGRGAKPEDPEKSKRVRPASAMRQIQTAQKPKAPQANKSPQVDKAPQVKKAPQIDKAPRIDKTPEVEKATQAEKTARAESTDKAAPTEKPGEAAQTDKAGTGTDKTAPAEEADGTEETDLLKKLKKLDPGKAPEVTK